MHGDARVLSVVRHMIAWWEPSVTGRFASCDHGTRPAGNDTLFTVYADTVLSPAERNAESARLTFGSILGLDG